MATEREWRTFFYMGSICVFSAVFVMLAEIFITALPDGARVPLTGRELLEMYNRNWFMGMRYMGLINIIASTLMIPVFFALYGVHNDKYGVLSALALVLTLISYTVFLSDNVSFPILELSKEYALANEMEREVLITATETLMAKGASHTPGTFPGFAIGLFGTLLFCVVIVKGNIFKKSTGYTGIAAFSFLLMFEIVSSFISSLYDQAMIFAMIGGLLAIVWYVLIGFELKNHAKKITVVPKC